MGMNEYKNFAGEVGFKISNKGQLRLAVMEVELTERHLSNKYEAFAIIGGNMTGYLQAYELSYDFISPNSNWLYFISAGYVHDVYQHTIQADQRIDNHTTTAGFGFGYKIKNFLYVPSLYLHFSMPFRYYFNSIPETKLADSTVREHKFVNNIWLFLGLDF